MHIIYWYGVPSCIIVDIGKSFFNSLMTNLCEKFKFALHKSFLYNPLANDLAKGFNKTFYNLLKKVVMKSKQD